MKPIKVADIEQLRYIAHGYQAKGDFYVAEQVYQVLLDLETMVFGTESGAAALCLYKLAELKFAQHKTQEGRELLAQAVAVWEKAYPSDYLSLLSYTEALAKVKSEQEKAIADRAPQLRSAA